MFCKNMFLLCDKNKKWDVVKWKKYLPGHAYRLTIKSYCWHLFTIKYSTNYINS